MTEKREYCYGLKNYINETKKTGRIISENKEDYILGTADGDIISIPKTHNMPPYYVGDIVEISEGKITDLILRKNTVEKSSNKTAKSFHNANKNQVLASNVDRIFILMALNQNFSIAKLERYILVFNTENIEIHAVLTKSDTCENYKEIIAEILEIYPHIFIHAISIFDDESIEELKKSFKKGETALLIGSSGAGKTSLTNKLITESDEKVGMVRSDGKGKHTTTSSKFLYSDKCDCFIIDTPGFKGIDKNAEIGYKILFEDIIKLSEKCKFADCKHGKEPGCAVRQAVADGILSAKKYERYLYNIGKM